MKFHHDTRLVHGRPLRLRLRHSKRARRLHVQVSAREGVVVIIPRHATLADVDEVFNSEADWVARRVDHYDVWDGPRRRSWVTGSELTVLGRPLRLELTPLPANRSRTRVEQVDGCLRFDLAPSRLLDPRPEIERWLRRFAGRHLRERTAALGEITGLVPRKVIVGERITRWGSCTSGGTISYCYRLVMAPAEVVDSVVVHELCHLVHGGHGPRFWNLLRELYPDYDRCNVWLREHGHELEI